MPLPASPQQRKDDAAAVTIFVLGILGIVFCALFAPFAWIKGASYRTTCRILGIPPNGLATAGWVLGIVGTVMMLLMVLFIVAMRWSMRSPP